MKTNALVMARRMALTLLRRLMVSIGWTALLAFVLLGMMVLKVIGGGVLDDTDWGYAGGALTITFLGNLGFFLGRVPGDDGNTVRILANTFTAGFAMGLRDAAAKLESTDADQGHRIDHACYLDLASALAAEADRLEGRAP